MAMPRKLKNMNLFNDGNTYQGVAKSVTPPPLGRKMESYRGGGMNGRGKLANRVLDAGRCFVVRQQYGLGRLAGGRRVAEGDR